MCEGAEDAAPSVPSLAAVCTCTSLYSILMTPFCLYIHSSLRVARCAGLPRLCTARSTYAPLVPGPAAASHMRLHLLPLSWPLCNAAASCTLLPVSWPLCSAGCGPSGRAELQSNAGRWDVLANVSGVLWPACCNGCSSIRSSGGRMAAVRALRCAALPSSDAPAARQWPRPPSPSCCPGGSAQGAGMAGAAWGEGAPACMACGHPSSACSARPAP